MSYSVAQVIAQLLSGLSYASTLFLVASGLSIIFGVTRIVNFAHGSFFMLGAYLAYTLTTQFPATWIGFWGGLILAALIVGVLGAVMEIAILRRIYHAPEIFQILATFGVILIVQNLTQKIWGTEELLAPRAPGLGGTINILGEPLPEYHLVTILIGPLVLALLWALFHRTRAGILIRAATQDREMAASLGVNQSLLFTGVVFLGCFLAGFAGAMQIPKEAVNLQMDLNIITEAFVVVVIGGMGSVLGGFLAALLIGELHAFGILVFPQITLVLIFVVMAVVLIFRPYGLLGAAAAAQRVALATLEIPYRPAGRNLGLLALTVVALLAALPAMAGEYAQFITTEMIILALLATSLHFLTGIGGIVSFGHAAYFGLGAYGVAFAAKTLDVSLFPGLAIAIIIAVAGALVFGWFCVRLSGVYLAMLTLAFAQILWSVSVQWVSVTGGDNGILGVWPSGWLTSKTAFYYVVLGVCVLSLWLLRRSVFTPFGYALRAGRDSPLRSDAIGINVRRHQWVAFTIAGAFAGLAGGLFAYNKGGVFPSEIAISVSVDSLVMVLLGGLQTLSGPIVGAATYHALQTEMVRHFDEYWRLLLGTVIVLLVILFPAGIVGYLRRRFERHPVEETTA